MGSDRDGRAALTGLALAVTGGALVGAWQRGMWGCMTGALLVALWLCVLLWRGRRPVPVQRLMDLAPEPEGGAMALRLLLDQLPTPLIAMEERGTRALNRAARALFDTDDRILPVPLALHAQGAERLVHAGRHWRIDRAQAGGAEGGGTILALIDIEAEERAGEARAAADMIQVMGHELLNGLAPIASLAESALAVWGQGDARREALMPDILATLTRRAEGLQRFIEGYRKLARLPDPVRATVSPPELLGDLTRLFEGRWRGDVALRIEQADDLAVFEADRDQVTQAVWALLQNAAEAALAGQNPPWVALSVAGQADQALICVRDSGPGVSPDVRARIFHPFHTTKAEGTGIGLSLARQIARAHGGDLRLGEGAPTSFALSLPRRG